METKPEPDAKRGGGGRKGAAPDADAIPDTSTGLLRDLEKGREATRWPDFERRYDPVVRKFLAIVARTHPLVDPDDCDDLVQETMIELWKLFPRRVYDRSRHRFRDFLFGVTRLVAKRSTSDELLRIVREDEVASGAADRAAAEADAAKDPGDALLRSAAPKRKNSGGSSWTASSPKAAGPTRPRPSTSAPNTGKTSRPSPPNTA